MIPDGMPTLSAGAHSPDDGRACFMELEGLLATGQWTGDKPSCTHPVLAEMARCVNDRLPDSERHRLVPLLGRTIGTAPTGTDHEQHVLSVRLAAWCARQVLDQVRPEDRGVVERAIAAAEGWCDGVVTAADAAYAAAAAAHAARAARTARTARAAYAADAAAYAADACATWAADATWAAAYAAYTAAVRAGHATWAAYTAAVRAGHAAYAADAADVLVGFLAGLLDEHDRLTGRTQHREVTETDLRALAASVGG